MTRRSGSTAILGIFLGGILVNLENHSADAWMPSLIASPKTRVRTHRAAYLGNLVHHSEGVDQQYDDDDNDDDDDANHQPSTATSHSVSHGETSLIAMFQRLAAEKKELEEAQQEPQTGLAAGVLAAHPADTAPQVLEPKGNAGNPETMDQSSKQQKVKQTNVVVPNSSGVGSIDSSMPREVEHDLQVAAFAPKDNKNGADKKEEIPVEEAVAMKTVGDLATADTLEQGSGAVESQDEPDVGESFVEEVPQVMDAKKRADEPVVPLTTTAAYMDSLDTTRNSDGNNPVDMPLPTLGSGIKLSTEEDLIQQHDALETHEANLQKRGTDELYQSQLQVAFGRELSYPEDKAEPDKANPAHGSDNTLLRQSKDAPAKLDQHFESANMVFESLEDLDNEKYEHNINNLENGVVDEDGGDELVQLLKQLLLDIHLGFTDMKTAMVTLMEEDPALERNQKYWNWGLETGGGTSDGESTGLLP